MKENGKVKNRKNILIIAVIFTLIFIVSFLIIFVKNNFNCKCESIPNEYKIFQYDIRDYNPSFLKLKESNLSEYEIIKSYSSYQKIKNSFKEYMIFLDEEDYGSDENIIKIADEFNNKKYDEDFFEKNNIILLETIAHGQVMHSAKFQELSKDEFNINARISYKASGVVAGNACALYFLVVEKDDFDENLLFNVELNTENNDFSVVSYKPIIYLYPKVNTIVNVKLGKPEKLFCSYPLYNDTGWEVMAEPGGMLTYLESGRKLYSLYYENENIVNFNIESDGFVIKGENTASFLEEKLELLGLNEIEVEEFIIYWLPKLEANKYNYIRFATMDEINKNMGLDIQPKPDSIIRVLMTFKGLEKPISVKEQKLVKPIREGFVVVEWGGTEIK